MRGNWPSKRTAFTVIFTVLRISDLALLRPQPPGEKYGLQDKETLKLLIGCAESANRAKNIAFQVLCQGARKGTYNGHV
jgi:hypothetical protein